MNLLKELQRRNVIRMAGCIWSVRRRLLPDCKALGAGTAGCKEDTRG